MYLSISNPAHAGTSIAKFVSNGFKGIDPNFSPIIIRFEGLTAGSAFAVEVRHCMELVPALGGDWSALATPPAPRNTPILDRVFKTTSEVPMGGALDNVVQAFEPAMRAFAIGMGQGVLRSSLNRMMGQLALNQ